jgi:hypothetical protein
MTAVAWRQHRLQLSAGTLLLGLLAVFLFWTEHQMTSYMHTTGLSGCLAAHQSCDAISKLVENRYGSLLTNIAYLNFFPLLLGLFWGAPLVAREVEQGTERLAWTQSVTRRRWFSTKLGLFAVAAATIGALFGLLLTWWYHPYANVSFHGGFSRMDLNVFDFEGIVPIGYSLYALALGTTAGVLIRRTLPAMAVTFAGFLPLRLWVQSLRGHFLAPLRVSYPLGAGPPSVERGAWVVHNQLTNRSGRPVTTSLLNVCPGSTKGSLSRCLVSHGLHYVDLYQPANRFWTLQGIEFAFYVGLALLLTGLSFWWLKHRVS